MSTQKGVGNKIPNTSFWALKFHFWPKKGSKGFFSEKSDSATFYPLYPPNFMQNKLYKSMDPHKKRKKEKKEKLSD